MRIELTSQPWQGRALAIVLLLQEEQRERIELSNPTWKDGIIPFNYRCKEARLLQLSSLTYEPRCKRKHYKYKSFFLHIWSAAFVANCPPLLKDAFIPNPFTHPLRADTTLEERVFLTSA